MQVPTCAAVLGGDAGGRRYQLRYRLCEPCMRRDYCFLDAAGTGPPHRFCQARALRARVARATVQRRAAPRSGCGTEYRHSGERICMGLHVGAQRVPAKRNMNKE